MLDHFHLTDLLDFAEQADLVGFDAASRSANTSIRDTAAGPERLCVVIQGFSASGDAPVRDRGHVPGIPLPPAVIAHAAATLGAMYPGRFWLGLGAGEALNEHVIGGEWPEVGIRSAMMFEAIEVIGKLFSGKVVKHDGEYFTLESARLYTIPETPVPIYVATAGPVNAKRTGRWADGIITVGAADDKINMLWDKFREGAAEAGKDASAMRTQLQIHVSWAPTQQEAEENALKEWPNGGMPFPKQDIKNPEDFANMAKLVRIENFANRMLISADLEEHTAQIQRFVDMGFDEVHLHNVGRNQAEFISTFGEQVLPNLKLS